MERIRLFQKKRLENTKKTGAAGKGTPKRNGLNQLRSKVKEKLIRDRKRTAKGELSEGNAKAGFP